MNHPLATIVNAAGTYASRMMDYVSERMHDYARRGIASAAVLGMLAAPQIGRAEPRELHGEVNGERCLEAEIITIYATDDAEHCAAGEKNFLQVVEDALSKRGYLVSETRQNVIISPRTGLPFLWETYGMGVCFPEGGGCDMPPALPSAKLAIVHNLQEGEVCESVARYFVEENSQLLNSSVYSTVQLYNPSARSLLPLKVVEERLKMILPPPCKKLRELYKAAQNDLLREQQIKAARSDRERIELLERQVDCLSRAYLPFHFGVRIQDCLREAKKPTKKPKSPSQ